MSCTNKVVTDGSCVTKVFLDGVILSGDVWHPAGEALGDLTLEARDELRHGLHDPVIFAVALVAPAPPRISAHLFMDISSRVQHNATIKSSNF
jgi:hypothetical protein